MRPAGNHFVSTTKKRPVAAGRSLKIQTKMNTTSEQNAADVKPANELTQSDVVAFLRKQVVRLVDKHPGQYCTIDFSVGIHSGSTGNTSVNVRAYVSEHGFTDSKSDIEDAVLMALDFNSESKRAKLAADKRAEAARLLVEAESLAPSNTTDSAQTVVVESAMQTEGKAVAA